MATLPQVHQVPQVHQFRQVLSARQAPPAPGTRHPLGLVVVAGLHVGLALALLQGMRVTRPDAPTPGTVVLLAPDDPPPPQDPDQPLQNVRRRGPPQPLPPVIPVPTDSDPDSPPPTFVRERLQEPGGSTTGGGTTDLPVVPLFEARPAQIHAGSASCQPLYPSAALRAGAQGSTRIRFAVDAMGQVLRAQVVQPSGPSREHRLMDQAAAEALQHCPVSVGQDSQGHPVGTTTEVEYVWRLN